MFDLLLGRSPDQFARRVSRRLRARGWRHAVTYDRGTFTLDTGGGSGSLYLGNLFRDWLAAPRRARRAQLDRALDIVFEAVREEGCEDVADCLMPVVRNLTHLQAMALQGSSSDASLEIWQPFRVLAGPLGVILAIDRPTSVALVQASKLTEWDCTFDTLLDRAMENLIVRSPVRFTLTDAGFHLSDYGDFCDSSRLLMPELFTALQVKGEPVAIAVSRSCVVVAGSEETEALDAMAAFVQRTLETETRPTSHLPLILRNGEWIAVEPDFAPSAAILELAVAQSVWDYAVQAPLLQAYLTGRGVDAFVAPLEQGRFHSAPHTWTSWTQDVPARLPRSDWIGLSTADGGRRIFRRWRDVEAVCGPFTADHSLHPPRFTPPPWPSPEAWRRLESEFAGPEWA